MHALCAQSSPKTGLALARGMRDVRDLSMITDAMLRRGYTEERIRKFWGGNLLRFFGQVSQYWA